MKRILTHSSPPAFRCPERPRPKTGPYLERIKGILDADKDLPRKQRHTAKRIFEVIREEGYAGGYTQVKEAVRELKRISQEVFVPLVHRPGEAQADFGQALVKMDGALRKVMFFAMVLPYSDAMFIAEHGRLWDKEAIAFEPVHYLELLERKPGALDHARPLCDWGLPECFALLRSRLEQEGRAQGTREFIRVLRLLERHAVDKVAKAIGKALRLRRCNRDVVAQYLYPDEPFSPPTFRLDGREHLQGVCVDAPDLAAYQGLLGGRS
jgi:hypothetical protein